MADLKYTVDIDTRAGVGKLRELRKEMVKTEAGFSKLNKGSAQVGGPKALSGISALRVGLAGLGIGAVVTGITQLGSAMIDTARRMEEYRNKLRLITKDSQDLARIEIVLAQTASKARVAYGDTVDLFSKLRLATDELGKSEAEVLKVTTKLSQALAVSGADAATTSSVVRQFGQAMASGTVRGDEFNSLVEGLGPALAIMAKETGKNVGELRRMSREGELTAEAMFEMLEKSKALEGAFNSMQPTIGQLETAFGDAFDRMLDKLGQASNGIITYKFLLESATRIADKLAGTTGLIHADSIEDVLYGVKDGAYTAAQATEEFNRRLKENAVLRAAAATQPWGVFFIKDLVEQNKKLKDGIYSMKSMVEGEKEVAEAAKEAADQFEKQLAAQNGLLKTVEDQLKLAEDWKKVDIRTPFAKAQDKITETKLAVVDLKLALSELEREGGKGSDAWYKIKEALEAADTALIDYQKSADKIKQEVRFDTLWADLDLALAKNQVSLEMLKEKLKEAEEEFKALNITAEQYIKIQEKITAEIEILAKAVTRANESVSKLQDGYGDLFDDEQFKIDNIIGTDFDRKVAEAERNIREMAKRSKDAIEAIPDLDPKVKKDRLAQIDAEMTYAIGNVTNKMKEHYNESRKWETGWKNSFLEFQEDATNAAENAAKVFDTATKSMEDSIVEFAKTGKFEFKDLASTILEELLRIQIQKTIAGIGGSIMSGAGSLFSGFFATGGMIPAGRYGVVGESGPELVEGPATVTPLNGGANVTYNINAVDALSFRQLVARDPGFIYAVTEQGRNRQTGGR